MDFNYSPKDESFSGHIKLTVPSTSQRIKMMSELGIDADMDGGVKTARGTLNILADVIELVDKKFVHEVSIKHSSGKEFKSFKELDEDPIAEVIITDIASLYLSGFKPSKN